MQRLLSGVAALALLGLLLDGNVALGQKVLLKTDGFGSLSGKVTLAAASPIPGVESLVAKMAKHADQACCLAGKEIEKIDPTWIVDKKTRGVANVMIWVTPPKGTYFPIHPDFKKRKDEVVIDQPHCAFLPRIQAFNPSYFDGTDMVPTGQKMIIKNSAVVAHNVRATGNPDINPGFNKTLPAKTELEVKFLPQRLPVNINCDIHTWMTAKLFVFDHPYYAITKDDGSYEIPFVPAGAEISVMAWHEGIGWVLTAKGSAKTLKAGKNTYDFELTIPPAN